MRFLYTFLIGLLSISVAFSQSFSDLPKPLRVDEAFQWTIQRNNDTQVSLIGKIADGYYLYRDKFIVESDGAMLDLLPEGKVKSDPAFGDVMVWTGQIEVSIGLQPSATSLSFKFQGCQDGGVCYPPTKLSLDLPQVSAPVSKGLFDLQKNNDSSMSSVVKKAGVVELSGETDKLLPEEQAFSPDIAFTDDGAVEVNWQVADGYYLYADKIQVSPENAIVNIFKSEAEKHIDDFFGEQNIYRKNAGSVKIIFNKNVGSEFTVSYQGCADRGVCYPIMKRSFPLVQSFMDRLSDDVASTSPTAGDKIAQALSGNMLVAIGLLLLAGIALAFTPCVLPMLPILLGMLHNQANLSRKRTVILAGAYALGMATMTAVFGIIVSLLDINLQIIFQKWWLLAFFATIFVVAGVSMLGVFDVNVPMTMQNKISQWQSKFSGGNPINTFIVGALSVLVVGPCVAPPLFAVLTYASTTGDVLKSGVYLFSLGLGMGLPLIVFAVYSNSAPKTGQWSVLLKQLMGWLLIAVALWLASRLLSGQVSLILWGVWMLGVACSVYRTLPHKNAKGVTALLAVIGVIWISGGVMGGASPLSPFTSNKEVDYIYVNDQKTLQKHIDSNEIVLVDFYADWCISCKENEAFVFTDEDVFKRLNEISVVKVDMTHTTEAHRELLKAYKLVGPPALIVFKNGKQTELMIGVVKKDQLLLFLKSGV